MAKRNLRGQEQATVKEMSPRDKAEIKVMATRAMMDMAVGQVVNNAKETMKRLERAIEEIQQRVDHVERTRTEAEAFPLATPDQIDAEVIKRLEQLVIEQTQAIMVQLGNASLGYQARYLRDADKASRELSAARAELAMVDAETETGD
jgi:hypothetical protein